jgi:fatty acid desaturase
VNAPLPAELPKLTPSDPIVPTPRIPKPGGTGWEWPTIAVLAGSFAIWGIALVAPLPLWLSIALLALALAQHSSLTHEILHGHPFPYRWMNEALGHVQIGLTVPYQRFRDLHLLHHFDQRLTDPYDDPESNYLDPVVWAGLRGWHRALLRFNNTLAGRLVVGPILSQLSFMGADLRAIRAGDRAALMGWAAHLPSVAATLMVVYLSGLPIWAYLLAVYLSMSILRIRTFLEHQAHLRASARTVIVEDRGILAFLFLNNSLHVVHHMHPRVPWYRLPRLYAANKAQYLARNQGYVYASYREIFARYLWRAKDPVPHPLWHKD